MMIWSILLASTIFFALVGNCEPLCQRNPGGIATLDEYSENGNVSGIGEYPWIIAIEISGSIQCAGAIILPQVVLTAAHCSLNINTTNDYVIAGVWNISNDNPDYPSQRIAIKDKKIAPGFNFNTSGLGNDISILILEEPITLNEYIDTVCLTNKSTIIEPCFLTGWGSLEMGGNLSQVPKNLTLPIVARTECEDIFVHSDKLEKNFMLSEKQFCAGGQNGSDTCQGDGGAPLVCGIDENDDRFILTGMTSWGIGCNGQFPGVYTNVSNFIAWINEIVEYEGFSVSDYLI